MATARDWADAYRQQARADLQAAERLGPESPSALAMLLQMTFEKLAKAALLRLGAVEPEQARRTHRAASALVQYLRKAKGSAAVLGFRHGGQWQLTTGTVVRLEMAIPRLPTAGLAWSTRGSMRGACSGPKRTSDWRPRSSHRARGSCTVSFDWRPDSTGSSTTSSRRQG